MSHQQVDTFSNPSGTPLLHDDEFWLEDGNIVLVTRNVGFRVYRALLAAQSTIFADTFAASSSTTDESYAGCPLVHLSDSPEDLRHLLRVLIPKTKRLFFPDQEKPTFSQVCAVVRLAHKYIIEDALLQGISALQSYYTADFEVFLKSSDTDEFPIDFFRSSTEPISVVNLVRLIDMPSLLPTALYDCCSLDGSVLDGYTREDGTVDYLSSDDLRRCLNGRDALHREGIENVCRIFTAVNIKCSVHTLVACGNAMREVFTDAVHSPQIARPTPLDSWADVIRASGERFGLCKSCIEHLLRRDVETRRDFWRRLPACFDLVVDGWPSDPAAADPVP